MNLKSILFTVLFTSAGIATSAAQGIALPKSKSVLKW